MKTLWMMLKKDMIYTIMKSTDYCLQEKKMIGLMKDKLGGKSMTELAARRPKTYSYLMDDGNKDKKAKGIKKRRLKFNNY